MSLGDAAVDPDDAPVTGGFGQRAAFDQAAFCEK
jgi:hypothetical protein